MSNSLSAVHPELVAAVKAIIASTKALIADIAAGSWIVVVECERLRSS